MGDGEDRDRWGRGEYMGRVGTSVRGIGGLTGRREWYVESPHILIGSLERTRTGFGSPGAKIDSDVGVKRQEAEWDRIRVRGGPQWDRKK